jgi:hypothetical protein
MKEFHHKYTYVKGRKCVCELKLKKDRLFIKNYNKILSYNIYDLTLK